MTATGGIPADSVRRPRHHESFPLRNKSCVVLPDTPTLKRRFDLEYLFVYQYSSNPPDTLTSFARFRIRCSNDECFIARMSNPKGAHIPYKEIAITLIRQKHRAHAPECQVTCILKKGKSPTCKLHVLSLSFGPWLTTPPGPPSGKSN